MHQYHSQDNRSLSLNAYSVLSKDSCALSPISNIGFGQSEAGAAGFRLQPSFNFDMYRQSLLLNENPISGKPPYYEVIDDPVSPYFDGSDKDAGGTDLLY